MGGREVLSWRISIFILLFNFTNMSEVISTRIPKELKEEMKRVNVNWEDFFEESDRGEIEGGKKENGGENDG